MPARYLSENSRIYACEFGSVWVKNLAKQNLKYTALSFHPAEKRMKAKPGSLEPAGMQPVVRLTTDCGNYLIGESQYVRLVGGEVVAVADLKTGVPLHSGVINNVEGNITVQTIYRDIWITELLEKDIEGFSIPLQERTDRREPKQWLLKIEHLEPQPCFRAVIECPTVDEPTPESGHNLLIWPDGTSFGAGIFVY
jgi:hypothetical protein